MKLATIITCFDDYRKLLDALTSGVVLVTLEELSWFYRGHEVGADPTSEATLLNVTLPVGSFLLISAITTFGLRVHIIYEEDILTSYSKFDFNRLNDLNPFEHLDTLSSKIDYLRQRDFSLSTDQYKHLELYTYNRLILSNGKVRDPGTKPFIDLSSMYTTGFALPISTTDIDPVDFLTGIELDID